MLFFDSKLYRQAYSDENLTEAWHHIHQGSEAAGSDGITITQFQRHLFSRMKALQQQLAERRYHPQPIRRFFVPKAKGDQRPVGILTVQDRIVQRAVLQVIEPLFEADFEECSFGYRPGRSPQMAIERLVERTQRGLTWVVDLDIRSFFDRVNVRLLESFIFKKLSDRELRRLIHSWLDAQVLTVERTGWLRCLKRRGILQGGILSPLFANVYLDQFDKMAMKHGLKHIRYADDILLLCSTQSLAHKALKSAERLLAKLDLELNPAKTEIVNATEGLRFLGQSVLLSKWNEQNTPPEGAPDGGAEEREEPEELDQDLEDEYGHIVYPRAGNDPR